MFGRVTSAVTGALDLNEILSGIDLNDLLDRLDLDRVLARIDVDSLVQNTELGGIIAKSTSGVASEALDVVRAQGVGLDGFVDRWMARLLRRDRSGLPKGPPLLVPDDAGAAAAPGEPR